MDNKTIEEVRKNETKLINEIKVLEQQCKNQKTIFGNEHGTIEEITKNYNERQEQNYYARVVRSKKKEILSLKGTNNTDILDKKKKELRNSQMKYRQYSKSKGLEVDYDKTWVAKYNK